MSKNGGRSRNNGRFVKHRPLEPGDAWIHPLLGVWTSQLRVARRSKETVRARAPKVQKFAEEMGVSPVSATSADIVDWFERHPEWMPATAYHYWSALMAWFKWLILQGHREDNPMMTLTAPHVPDRVPRPVSDADLRRLLSVRMQDQTRVKILLASLAGLRVSEIARIRGEDVDLSGRLLYVKGKGGAIKSVPLHPLLVSAAIRMPRSGYWFPAAADGKGSGPVTGHSVSRTISRAMGRAGVRATPHALRHWFGTNALRASGDLRVVQTLMRHSSVNSTQIYTEVADDRRSEVVDKLSPFGDAKGFLDGE